MRRLAVATLLVTVLGAVIADAASPAKWTIQPISKPAVGDLAGVSCTSAMACTAVGGSGVNYLGPPQAERWNGHE